MKQKSLIVSLAIVCLLAAIYIYNNFFTVRMIEGQYVNRNYNYSSNKAEIPYTADTLILLENNKFSSRFWGGGSYQIIYSISGTEIELIYNDEFGKAGFRTFINRRYFGKPRIILTSDHNHYYEKL